MKSANVQDLEKSFGDLDFVSSAIVFWDGIGVIGFGNSVIAVKYF